MNRKRLRWTLALATLGLLGLTACSSAPITINLVPLMGSYTSGSLEPISVPPGSYNVSLWYPSAQGYTLKINQSYSSLFTSASINYGISMKLSGLTGVSGTGKVQLYLAPAGTTNIEQSKYALGPSAPFDFSQNAVSVQGQAKLNSAQLQALKSSGAHQMMIIIHVSGTLSSSGGSLTMNYNITQLELSLTVF